MLKRSEATRKFHADLFEQRTMTVSFRTVHCEENPAIATTVPRVQTRVTKAVRFDTGKGYLWEMFEN